MHFLVIQSCIMQFNNICILERERKYWYHIVMVMHSVCASYKSTTNENIWHSIAPEVLVMVNVCLRKTYKIV